MQARFRGSLEVGDMPNTYGQRTRSRFWWLPHITWFPTSLGTALLRLVTQQQAQRRV